MPIEERDLLGTTDAGVWADEFMRIFPGSKIVREDGQVFEGEHALDLLRGWFANSVTAGEICEATRIRCELRGQRAFTITQAHPFTARVNQVNGEALRLGEEIRVQEVPLGMRGLVPLESDSTTPEQG